MDIQCLCGFDRTLTKGVYICDNCDTVQESEQVPEGKRVETKRDYAFKLKMNEKERVWYARV